MKEKQIGYLFGGVILLLVFTYFGFFNPQECDIDKIYLSCRLHPFTVGDFIGCVLFYGGTLLLTGITRVFGLDLYNAPNSSAWDIGTFATIALGVILIWNT